MDRVYIAIDLKSFYASAECVQRGLNPLTTNLVVADASRTEKTICLAVSPSLKSYGIGGRARLFEVVQAVKIINRKRKACIGNRPFRAKSYDNPSLIKDSFLELDYIVAKPRMADYLKISRQIYNIYLRYVAPQDIHVYSVDEVFIDVTPYLSVYKMDARQMTMMLIKQVLKETGITATAGIGTNLYLCKIAMDVEAKHIAPDKDGVRIAYLDEKLYREKLWTHTPLTDFWRIGHGISARLEKYGMKTMGDVARVSLYDERLLFRIFGINAELLIDHAWGVESCTMQDIKSYKSQNRSLSMGQVLSKPYPWDKARLIVREMADNLTLELNQYGLKTNLLDLTVNYDTSNIANVEKCKDWYGKPVPKPAHLSINLVSHTCSDTVIVSKMLELFERISDKRLTIRRISMGACNILTRDQAESVKQLDLFEDFQDEKALRRQQAILQIKNKFGKNALMKASDLEEGATAIQRNNQIGGHNA